jgi:hypothetical protein
MAGSRHAIVPLASGSGFREHLVKQHNSVYPRQTFTGVENGHGQTSRRVAGMASPPPESVDNIQDVRVFSVKRSGAIEA